MPASRRNDLERLLRADTRDRAEKARLAERFLAAAENQELVDELTRQPEEDDNTSEIELRTLALVRAFANSRLFPLSPHGSPNIAGLFSADTVGSETGTIVGEINGEPWDTHYEMRRLVGHPRSLLISTSAVLPRMVPICVVAAHLWHCPRQSAVKSFRPEMLGIEDENKLLGLAAEAGPTEDHLAEPEAITGCSSDLRWELDPTLLLLDVSGTVPEDRDSDTVVASLRLREPDGKCHQQDRLVDLRIEATGNRKKGNTGFDWPLPTQCDAAELTVRSLADTDVHLLDSRQVVDVLAHAEARLTFPLQPHSDGNVWEFQPTDLQRLAEDSSLAWFLQVSPSLEE